MEIIIYDTEITAWPGSLQRNWQGPNEFKEIIQLSAAKMCLSKANITVTDEINYYVKPTKNNNLSDYIKELTSISQDNVDSGLHPITLYEKLKQFSNNGNIPFYSWGNDYHVLLETAKINSTELSWIKSHDLRPIFFSHGVPKNIISGTLYQYYELDLNISSHNAKDDTLSLTESLKHLFHKSPNRVRDFFNTP